MAEQHTEKTSPGQQLSVGACADSTDRYPNACPLANAIACQFHAPNTRSAFCYSFNPPPSPEQTSEVRDQKAPSMACDRTFTNARVLMCLLRVRSTHETLLPHTLIMNGSSSRARPSASASRSLARWTHSPERLATNSIAWFASVRALTHRLTVHTCQ